MNQSIKQEENRMFPIFKALIQMDTSTDFWCYSIKNCKLLVTWLWFFDLLNMILIAEEWMNWILLKIGIKGF